ncbi:UvrABC system protein B [Spirochaeta thermophila DSM 6578]|uniref:UvrABC system protein B n=1 Tax=Winmispira thermophila (strain ATCC 700085 / DSM 6578 / Z-1203) TaxID=869211 RepID=G0G9T0_WINT7|nr:excinuclease ABC subunit UvrB [Spirochaeta thermophila]AEJ60830.1 UvrABC system protein B [Spirochaeta thermophila DSM 6578]
MSGFRVEAPFGPAGDQGKAIALLSEGVKKGYRYQTLKGVTGSGKTFTMAKIVEEVQLPTLVISHNKTLAAQLYREFKEFFPHNAVEYFVSYYDYYQPEAYVASKDLYIEKDASINEEIDRLRLSATASLMERPDVIVVATVSCIYGLGNPEHFREMRVRIDVGQRLDLGMLKQQLVSLQYERNDAVLTRGTFRVRGEIVDIYPAYLEHVYRVELDWDEVVSIKVVHPLTLEVLDERKSLFVYPAKHFVLPEEQVRSAIQGIREELDERYRELLSQNKLVEAQRLKARTEYDLEMLEEMGYCSGIENYSRHLSGRKPGQRPAVLLDYFPDRFLVFIDESHVTLPQLKAMYEGDRSRKLSLVEYGFRLPSALDNRPLRYEEFESIVPQVIYVSATPEEEELSKSSQVVEQVIRPTGLLDPEVEVRPTEGQIDDLYAEIRKRVEKGQRVLVTTLTKKMAEDLTDYLQSLGLRVRYLHAEVETIERVELLRDLRAGEFDVLVGINLLREGLDLPEVALVAILDADKIGFLRSATSLIQIMGRAARNAEGKVIMYADRVTDAMREAIEETRRRRTIQEAYNREHGITPQTIQKSVRDILERRMKVKEEVERKEIEVLVHGYNILVPSERKKLIQRLEKEMLERAKNLEFEMAAVIRDEIARLKEMA